MSSCLGNPILSGPPRLAVSQARKMARSIHTPSSPTRTENLVQWSASLRYKDLPDDVVQRTKDFFLDWLGCAVAGRAHPAVKAMERFARKMGPSDGKCELVDGSCKLTTSPMFASMVNGASSHVVEQDDLHNRSIMHPVWATRSSLSIVHLDRS